MTEVHSFRFVPSVLESAAYPGTVARVTGREWGKNELITTLADQLAFPSYFGLNWDALEECLSDLLPNQGRRVVIVHEVLPQGLSENELRVYLQILAEVGDRREQGGEPPLIAVFPMSECVRILELLRGQPHSD